MTLKRFTVGKVHISRCDIPRTLSYIEQSINTGNINYICVTCARAAYTANKYKDYCQIQNNSLLTVPDGTPLVWIAKNYGLKDVSRVNGHDLMKALFAISTEKGYSHYFYGNTPSVIRTLTEKLTSQYPRLDIKKAVSPPFQPLEDFDIDALAEELNTLKPTFFWCGLSAPKQERFNALLQPKLVSTICIGVGLAFENIAGTVKRAPLWMQKAGLEWAFRYAQTPHKFGRTIIPYLWIAGKLIQSFIIKPKNLG